MESANFIELVIALCKDKVQQELLDRFVAESRLLSEADADARRTLAREDIMTMVRLKKELAKFTLIYNRISVSCGPIPAVDDYIRDIEKMIKQLSFKKNNIK